MISGIISFLFGILFLQQFSTLPALFWCWALLLIVAFPFIPKPFIKTKLIVLFLIGFLWALWRAHCVLDVSLSSELQGKDVLVTGVVASIPIEDNRKRRFEFDIESIKYKGGY